MHKENFNLVKILILGISLVIIGTACNTAPEQIAEGIEVTSAVVPNEKATELTVMTQVAKGVEMLTAAAGEAAAIPTLDLFSNADDEATITPAALGVASDVAATAAPTVERIDVPCDPSIVDAEILLAEIESYVFSTSHNVEETSSTPFMPNSRLSFSGTFYRTGALITEANLNQTMSIDESGQSFANPDMIPARYETNSYRYQDQLMWRVGVNSVSDRLVVPLAELNDELSFDDYLLQTMSEQLLDYPCVGREGQVLEQISRSFTILDWETRETILLDPALFTTDMLTLNTAIGLGEQFYTTFDQQPSALGGNDYLTARHPVFQTEFSEWVHAQDVFTTVTPVTATVESFNANYLPYEGTFLMTGGGYLIALQYDLSAQVDAIIASGALADAPIQYAEYLEELRTLSFKIRGLRSISEQNVDRRTDRSNNDIDADLSLLSSADEALKNITEGQTTVAENCEVPVDALTALTATGAYRTTLDAHIESNAPQLVPFMSIEFDGFVRQVGTEATQYEVWTEASYGRFGEGADATVSRAPEKYRMSHMNDVLVFGREVYQPVSHAEATEGLPFLSTARLTSYIGAQLVGSNCQQYNTLHNGQPQYWQVLKDIPLEDVTGLEFLAFEGDPNVDILLEEGRFWYSAESDSDALIAASYLLHLDYDLSADADALVAEFGASEPDEETQRIIEALRNFEMTVRVFQIVDPVRANELVISRHIETFGPEQVEVTIPEMDAAQSCSGKALVRYGNNFPDPLLVIYDGPEVYQFEIPARSRVSFCIEPGTYLQTGAKTRVRDFGDSNTCYNILARPDGEPSSGLGCLSDPSIYMALVPSGEDPSPGVDNPAANAPANESKAIKTINETDADIEVVFIGQSGGTPHSFVMAPQSQATFAWGSPKLFHVSILQNDELKHINLVLVEGGALRITDTEITYIDFADE